MSSSRLKSTTKDRRKPSATALARVERILQSVAILAGGKRLTANLEKAFRENGVLVAISNGDSRLLFQWLMEMISYQGISDYVARAYQEQHGQVTWFQVHQAIERKPSCPKLQSYWSFTRCGYRKEAQCCNEAGHFGRCPLPLLKLRNGRLNQSAFSLYFFRRDVANNDLIRWLDDRVAAIIATGISQRAIDENLVRPLSNIHGLSDKVVAMVLTHLFLGCGSVKPDWLAVGGQIVVIDTLVHNFLHRTGILKRMRSEHAYGPGCYLPGRCRDLLLEAARDIDARLFNRRYPTIFPRLLQQAIWKYCAGEQMNVCNGNKIDDTHRCTNTDCALFENCDRIPLNAKKARKR